MKRILGIDASSTSIGVVLFSKDVDFHEVIALGKDKATIAQRIERAYRYITHLICTYIPDVAGIEAPVDRFARSLIPQARVSGAIILALQQGYITYWREISPRQAKRTLTGSGKSTKEDMLRTAARLFGYDPDALTYKKVNGVWSAYDWKDAQAYTEHEADALGVVLAVKGGLDG